ncbi:NUDIX domain-containing protein [Alkalibacterium gilvum]|uniref:NUDIX domain-containing protein n=1 Tax=Alkalibacterium gilvum TaxID=1130080 RepID=A0A1H6T9U7_9LACT|nr:NUDIX domain-containing protein [Alkalibacterium gilvum]SEI76818.1 NUDIX domain-containing protein [Alkalibacterium gilvum]
MQGYNLLMIYNKDMTQLLMCKRLKNPYKGLSNLVGGKIKIEKSGTDAACRELFKETNLSEKDVTLHHLIDFTSHVYNIFMGVYVLNRVSYGYRNFANYKIRIILHFKLN